MRFAFAPASVTTKRVPRGELSSVTLQPQRSAMRLTTDNPTPDPSCPADEVPRKNFS